MAGAGSDASRERAEGFKQATTLDSMEKLIRDFANLFKLLSDGSRLRILDLLLRSDDLNVTNLSNLLGQAQPAVSHHLALLRVAGLIEARRSGKNNFYAVRNDQFSKLLVRLLSSTGAMPKKVRFHDFTLSFQGR
jgi:ArsR family transcriptional regulator